MYTGCFSPGSQRFFMSPDAELQNAKVELKQCYSCFMYRWVSAVQKLSELSLYNFQQLVSLCSLLCDALLDVSLGNGRC